MRVPLFTWRAWHALIRKGWPWRARPSRPGPHASGWRHCGGSVLPNDAHHRALDDHVALVDAQRRHRGVGGLQPDPAAGLAIVALDRGAGARDLGDDHLAVVRRIALVHDDVVAVLDLLVDHRLAAYLEYVAAAALRQQVVGDSHGVAAREGFDGVARGHL